MSSTTIDAVQIARRLDAAWESAVPIDPLTASGAVVTAEQAYAVQTAWTELRLARGDAIAGRKIGLTSLAMQEQLGVTEPDYGSLWTSRHYECVAGAVEIPTTPFIQAKLEGELAFLIGAPLPPGEITTDDALAATAAIAPCVEVVDSRIREWQIKLPDTIADNASYGAFAVGAWSEALRASDLPNVEMTLELAGKPVASGQGAAAMGHPATCVAWLANKLRTFGVELQPGEIVLSGSLARAVDVAAGDEFVLRVTGAEPLTVSFV